MNLHKRSAINVFSGSKNEEPVGHAFRMKSFGRHDYQKKLPNLKNQEMREKNPQDELMIPKKPRNGEVTSVCGTKFGT